MMTIQSHWKAVAWLCVLFASGLFLGHSVSGAKADQTRRGWNLEEPIEQKWVNRHFENLVARFDLSEEQQTQLKPAFTEAESELRRIREQMQTDMRKVFAKNRASVIEVMTPEQRKAYEIWRRNWQKNR